MNQTEPERRASDRPTDLPAVLRRFAMSPNPWFFLLMIAVGFALRAQGGAPTALDLAIGLGLLAFQPLREWLIHVFVLHLRPRVVAGVEIDLDVAQKHRAHHRDPSDLALVFIPALALIEGALLEVLVWTSVFGFAPITGTTIIWSAVLGLHYEWVHYLCHVPYPVKWPYYRELVRVHRLHHFRSERAWFGVSAHLADRAFGTHPGATEVPISATARDLYGDAAARR